MKSDKLHLANRDKLYYRLSMAAGFIIFIAVVATSAAFTWKGFNRDIDRQVELLRETAIVFGSAISMPLSQGNQHQVQQALTGIAKLKTYRFVEVLDRAGKPFAEMGFDIVLTDRSTNLKNSTKRDLLNSNDLWVSENVVYAGTTVGTVRLLANITTIRNSFFWELFYNLLASLALALAATYTSRIVIHKITQPIYDLSQSMTRLGTNFDYNAQVADTGKGEIGLLAKSFNQMLSAIETRNRQLIEYQETLEERVEARTRDLKIAKDEADNANAAKSDFLATMTHEIRTPMNSMLVMSELLATSGLNPRHQRYAEIIAKSGRGLLAIINDILDLSKIQAGKLELEKITVNTRQVLEDTLSLYFKPAFDKGLDISLHIDENVPDAFLSDPTRLQQILNNLFNNALKFTQDGSISLTLKGITDSDGTKLRFGLADTGIGISEENSKRIFESFGQADQTTTRRFGGTGLGLTICRRLIEAMGGEFGLTSHENIGSEFYFTLPVTGLKNSQNNQEADYSSGTVLLIYPKVPSRDVIIDAFTRCNFKTVAITPDENNKTSLDEYSHIVSTTQVLARFSHEERNNVELVAIGSLEEPMLEQLVLDEIIIDCIIYPIATGTIVELAKRLKKNKPLGSSWYQTSHPTLTRDEYPSARLLLVDDNAINREVAIIALAKFGIKPIVAENGFEAIELFGQHKFDLVLMDCSMPDIDGFEATKLIRDIEKASNQPCVPIIALTAHIAEHIGQKAEKAGMNAIIVKPFTMDDMSELLKKHLKPETGNKADNLINHEKKNDHGQTGKTPSQHKSEDDNLVFDASMLANLRDIAGDNYDAMLDQLKSLYTQNAPEIFEKLIYAIEEDNQADIGSLSHALKSMSFNIGARAMGNACQKLENAALSSGGADNTICEINARFEQVIIEFEKVMDALPLAVGRSFHKSEDDNAKAV